MKIFKTFTNKIKEIGSAAVDISKNVAEDSTNLVKNLTINPVKSVAKKVTTSIDIARGKVIKLKQFKPKFKNFTKGNPHKD